MTENKRFSVKQRQGATNYSIRDYYGELPLSEGMYYKSNAEKLCKWLNTQHELLNTLYKENEQLKKEISQLRHWNKCLAEKRHQEISYRPYTDSKSEKELQEFLEQKVFNCSDR